MRSFGTCLFYFCAVILVGTHGLDEHPDIHLSIEKLIQKYGYPVEVHEVTTQDGYMLTMYRIPHGRQGSGVNRKPILLMHGLFGQSENYIVSGMNNASLAYYLADRDYDVWLGNSRGTQHGRKHVKLNPNRREFWDYSYHEIGVYDLPAKIDYILETTKKKKIYYIGHSQGGTAFYIMSSERPEYQDKIAAASLLAPAGLMGHFGNTLLLPFVRSATELTKLLDRMNIEEFPPREINLPTFIKGFCQGESRREFCLNVYYYLTGGVSGEFNSEMFALIARFVPSVAKRQPLHYTQAIMSGRFKRYDFGSQMNMRKYRSIDAPEYALRNITVPVALYYSLADNLVYKKDIEESCEALANCVRKYLIPNPKWTHFDFIFGINGEKMFHEPLYSFLEKYDKT